MSKKYENFAKFQKFQFDNLVDFEKCCKTPIYLQKSVPIQPKTSRTLLKICQIFWNFGLNYLQIAPSAQCPRATAPALQPRGRSPERLLRRHQRRHGLVRRLRVGVGLESDDHLAVPFSSMLAPTVFCFFFSFSFEDLERWLENWQKKKRNYPEIK